MACADGPQSSGQLGVAGQPEECPSRVSPELATQPSTGEWSLRRAIRYLLLVVVNGGPKGCIIASNQLSSLQLIAH